jgi:hypothetical protein
MKKFFNNLKAGAKHVPALLILIYFFIIFLDLLTTYLASPNLSLEGNWIIRYFKLTWSEIILLSSVSVIVLTICLIFSFFYINYYYTQKSDFNKPFLLEIVRDKKLVLSFIVLTFFYSHFSYSVFVVVNNYLSYLYLFDIDNSLGRLAHLYISKIINGNLYIYKWIMSIFFLLGVFYSFFKINRIRGKHLGNRNNLRG